MGAEERGTCRVGRPFGDFATSPDVKAAHQVGT